MSRKPCQHANTVRIVASIEGVPLTDAPERTRIICKCCGVSYFSAWYVISEGTKIPVTPKDRLYALDKDELIYPDGASLTILETT